VIQKGTRKKEQGVRKRGQPGSFFFLVACSLFLLPYSFPFAAIDLSKGTAAFEQRQWSASLEEFLKVLEHDPGNIEARAYINLIARQMEAERRLAQRQQRLTMLEDASRRLENNRQDSTTLQRAVMNTAQAEQRAQQERWRLICEESRMKREAGQLLAANDILFQVLSENPSYAEAQRELSELQSALRRAIDSGHVASIAERYAYEGFYAYGQADYENALAAWRKVRAVLQPGSGARETSGRLSDLRFVSYEKIAQLHVAEQQQLAELKRLFDRGLELYRTHRYTESLDVFRQVAIRDPEFPLLGHHLVQAEAAAEKDRARRLGETKRQELETAWQRGTDALVHEKFTEAIRAFEKVLSLDASHAQARSYLAMARSELQRQHDPKAAQARYESGLVSYASGRLDEAAREWRMALRLDGSHEKARIALGKVQKELAMSQELP